MIMRFKSLFYYPTGAILLAAFFGLPEFSQESTAGPILIAPFAQTTPRTVFDEPVYRAVPTTTIASLIENLGDEDILGIYCELDGALWLDELPGPTYPCWPPGGCPTQNRCNLEAPGKRCREGHWSDPCIFCTCARRG
ncbi:MAG: hypothetical protein ABIN58_11990 [candidate division WOR-3 bacterium]